MSLKHFLPALAISLIAFISVLVLWRATQTVSAQVGPIYQISSASSTNVLSASKSIVATSTGRRYLEINNLGSTAIYCAYNDVPATLTTGFMIGTTSAKLWYGENLYTGAIRCIAAGTVPVTMHEVF